MMNKVLLAAAAAFEAVTGITLIFAPNTVRLLLGTDISRAAVVVTRVAGFGLLSLGVACWPRIEGTIPRLRVMLIYNLVATAGLGYLRFSSQSAGKLLLPALVVHAVLAILFIGACLKH